ncbi:MAG: hypothetical protein GPI90_00505 [Microcystis aeruginosa K13-05]|uniref:Uncharacterized protein n=5 Tax=Microcystis aeruginosa TaxID=1126 RepID=I4I598_MICAE|nr:hypothetical protein [Microcystis aeruginosa K13-06]NCR78789.1 hypothetical protein [Microcystis aeruginosa K13-10]NCR83209.1 hypothetical protein [Microcystis aeruginosa K13-05]OPF16868.1 hypothetical protein B1L04_12105 [Microcystis aeruginosa KW]TRT43226.1 MAG: hypothetical protein EWV85_22525 [Microcystis aeruginosa Ma_QC_C_20070703_M131]CCH98043.1 conserved hypothetical protein [Microcystis aeruginosa PCC 9717]CCI29472.1 conserved hypothetical protein [Microcystis aeruginosa PCC 9809]
MVPSTRSPAGLYLRIHFTHQTQESQDSYEPRLASTWRKVSLSRKLRKISEGLFVEISYLWKNLSRYLHFSFLQSCPLGMSSL